MASGLDNIWESVSKLIKSEINEIAYNTFISPIKPIKIQGDNVVLSVPNQFTKNLVETRYKPQLSLCFNEVVGSKLNIIFLVAGEEDDLNFSNQNQELSQEDREEIIGQLNPKYTFDTFVIGNSNRFAHAASLAVAESPARTYNPLFIYGGVGLGKTHLMQAIGHYMIKENSNARVVYVSSEKFTNELINSIRESKNEEFRNKYRNVDILLVDDIQFIAGKEGTQEEFFHTFNALHEANKQIVISSDRPPKDIPTLEDRLRSRFEWGLITDIQAPDLETRVAILRKKANMENLTVGDDVMLYIASNIQSNIRELEGALIRVVAYSSLTNSQVSLELAEEALKDIISEKKARVVTPKLIQEYVGKEFGLEMEDFQSKKRTRSIAYPRQIAMYLTREMTDLSLPKIGSEFGGRDHTTVIHAYDKISEDIQSDSQLKERLDRLMKDIQGK